LLLVLLRYLILPFVISYILTSFVQYLSQFQSIIYSYRLHHVLKALSAYLFPLTQLLLFPFLKSHCNSLFSRITNRALSPLSLLILLSYLLSHTRDAMSQHFLTLVIYYFFFFGLFVNCIDDPYKVLGVSKSASPDEIKKAYKILALKWY